MKKTLFIITISISTFVTGCTKSDSEIALLPNDLAKSAVIPGPQNGSRSSIYLNDQGVYVCNFLGGTINFGNSFIYPTTSQPLGTPYLAQSLGAISGENNFLEFKLHSNGYNFSILYGTFSSAPPANAYLALSDYQEALDNWFSGKINPQTGIPIESFLPNFQTYLNRYALQVDQVFTSSDGILTITGSFGYDPMSPTNISLMGIVSTPAPNPDFPYLDD